MTHDIVPTYALCRGQMHDNMLKLITDKTEVTFFASQRNVKFVENALVTVGESNNKSSSCVNKPWRFL